MHQNLKAFLDMIAWSEGTAGKGDDGYNVLVGGGLFEGYADHPRQAIYLSGLRIKSTAAGRYQILARFFDHYRHTLGLKDFSPASQDAIAVQLIRECKAMEDIEAGRLEEAVTKCRSRWASLPGAGYGQHEQDYADVEQAYLQAGGTLA
jgi:muramidase (phage lysozyme)